jgi:hypothetical protein
MLHILDEVLTFFSHIYDADDRPEARSITLGCAAVAVGAILLLALVVCLSR